MGVGPQVADGALDVFNLVWPAIVGAEPVVDADHHEALGGQIGPDLVDEEATGVVIARHPGSAVDVDGGRCRPVQSGRFGNFGRLVVAVGHRDLRSGRQRRSRACRRRHGR
jgi:hypothetical protein